MIQTKIILGSGSPRRKQLLEEMGFTLEIIPLDIDESFPEDLACEEVAHFVAEQKMNALKLIKSDDQILLTADTTVISKNQLLGKPANDKEAFAMLQFLSGTKHIVNTAVVIALNGNIEKIDCQTEVYFNNLTTDQINYYLDKYKPFDKAGSYGIQDWIGLIGINQINGSYTNVVGLPTDESYKAIQRILS